MNLDLNTLINLGVLAVLAFLVRSLYALREDFRAIKEILGMNGNPDRGLIWEVSKLRKGAHDRANDITTLEFEVANLKERAGQ